MTTIASDIYEEWRSKYEYDPGERRLKPWALLTAAEKQLWEEEWRHYTGENDTTDGVGGVKHGDPHMTRRHKPIARG